MYFANIVHQIYIKNNTDVERRKRRWASRQVVLGELVWQLIVIRDSSWVSEAQLLGWGTGQVYSQCGVLA